jgi:site-specific DNA recombinase
MLKNTFDPRRPHRYVRYGRMSTDRQNERSPEQQFDTIDATIRRSGHPWIHVGDYRDDGVSGRLERKRIGYQEMLRDVRGGALGVDLILVDTAERFGRTDELTSIRRDLYNRHGVLVLTADSGFADPTTTQGRALAFVETMRATEDGRIKAHNVLRGKRDAARLKHWPGGPPPFGYKLSSVLAERQGRQEVDHCVLVPDPATSWIIARLFELAMSTGWGTQRLAKELNADPEIPGEHKPVYPDTVGYWLRNPIYYGELLWEAHSTGIVDDTRVVRPNPEEDVLRIPGFCEPLVPRETWDAVAELRRIRSEHHSRSRRRHPGDDAKQIRPVAPGLALKYLLSGLVRCGLCGRSMRATSSGGRHSAAARPSYYACPGAGAGVCPNRTYLREDTLRRATVARLRERLFPRPLTSTPGDS